MTELFNACEYLLDRRIAAGDEDRIALTGIGGELTYGSLLDRVQRTAAALTELGLQPEQRLVLVCADGVDFVTLYLAAMRIGAVPVPLSTMLRVGELADLLRDSRARIVATTTEFADTVSAAVVQAPEITGVIACAGASVAATVPVHPMTELLTGPPRAEVYPTWADSPAFWLYTSGTTGRSKAAMHRHGSVPAVCESYGAQVLGIGRDDRCLSAAKGFFAYGLGNSVLFPLSVGACAVLEPAPAKPDLLAERAATFGATLFFGGPTFFANMLRSGLPADALGGVRLAASAGEPLPATLYRRWTEHFGVDILDGIGMTEMLHIFLSNRAGAVRPGTTGVAVPGYDLRILDDDGTEVGVGEPGTLYVRGASTATGYWARYDASRQVFCGDWLRTGDTYVRDADGYYTCLGRTGDMLKASGIWVSPAEVEARLLAHEGVGQAVVVAALDADGLEKPVAFVLLNADGAATEQQLIDWCHDGLAAFKRPRRIHFVTEYPTTATGKVRRVDLRVLASAAGFEAVG
jgi:benzoate-CoA ligase family protein